MSTRRSWPLRTRLLIALLAIAAVGLVVFGTVSVLLLKQSLLTRVDQHLSDTANKMESAERPPPETESPSTESRLPTDFRAFFFSPAGTYLSTLGSSDSANSMPQLPPMDIASVNKHGSAPFTAGSITGNTQWRIMVVVQAPTQQQPQGGTAAVGELLTETTSTVNGLAAIELICGSIVLLCLGITAAVVVRIGLRPLTKIEHTAQAIAAGELDRRIPDTDQRTEVGRLGASLNVMLARISAALQDSAQSQRRLRRFVADASHELRTPLTSIRGFAELYRRGGASQDSDVQRLMLRIESEAKRMGLLVEDLLLLARLDQERSLDFTEVDLLVLAADAVHDARASAPERSITLDAPNGTVKVLGDEYRLRQVVMNLVTNAVAHTPPKTPINISVRQERTRPNAEAVAAAGGELPTSSRFAVLEVLDEGPGIPADQGAFVFDRFYRADQARSRTKGGAGLGLAITAAIVEAHSGRIELSTTQGRTSFRVLLAPV